MNTKLSEKQRKIAFGATVVVVLVAAGLFVLAQRSDESEHRWLEPIFSLWSPVIGPGNHAPAPAAVAAVTPSPEEIPADYGAAVNAYAGRRFQFTGCNGTPGTLVAAKGSKILLDNRDDAAITVKIGSATYPIGAYGYSIVTLAEIGELTVTCNGAGAAVLTVES